MKENTRMFGGFFSRKAWTAEDERQYRLEQEALEQERKENVKVLLKKFQVLEAITEPEAYLAAKREMYYCGDDYWRLEDFPTWAEEAEKLSIKQRENSTTAATAAPAGSFFGRAPQSELRDVDRLIRFPVNHAINQKVSLFQGDITTLEIDAIVNAANSSLRGGGGIDGAIHNAAGDLLYEECVELNGCPTGYTKVTKGYDLPAEYVLHTVGPMGRGDEDLERCYRSVLDHVLASHRLPTMGDAVIQAETRVVPSSVTRLAPMTSSLMGAGVSNSAATAALPPTVQAIAAYDPSLFAYRRPIRSLGICCISTGIFSFPRVRATHIALRTVREWLETHHDLVDRVVFVVFGNVDLEVYRALMPAYFPVGTEAAEACPRDLMFPYGELQQPSSTTHQQPVATTKSMNAPMPSAQRGATDVVSERKEMHPDDRNSVADAKDFDAHSAMEKVAIDNTAEAQCPVPYLEDDVD
jgi:O-acetyl-ADP-ribose deacetylase (regulator of RNase III)